MSDVEDEVAQKSKRQERREKYEDKKRKLLEEAVFGDPDLINRITEEPRKKKKVRSEDDDEENGDDQQTSSSAKEVHQEKPAWFDEEDVTSDILSSIKSDEDEDDDSKPIALSLASDRKEVYNNTVKQSYKWAKIPSEADEQERVLRSTSSLVTSAGTLPQAEIQLQVMRSVNSEITVSPFHSLQFHPNVTSNLLMVATKKAEVLLISMHNNKPTLMNTFRVQDKKMTQAIFNHDGSEIYLAGRCSYFNHQFGN